MNEDIEVIKKENWKRGKKKRKKEICRKTNKQTKRTKIRTCTTSISKPERKEPWTR